MNYSNSIDDIEIRLTNFLGIKSADVKLDNLSIVVGYNCTSKTTLLRCAYSVLKTIQLSRESDSYNSELLKLQFFKSFGIPFECIFQEDTEVKVIVGNDTCSITKDSIVGVHVLSSIHISKVYFISSPYIIDQYSINRDAIKLGSRPMATLDNGISAREYDTDIVTDILYSDESSTDILYSDESSTDIKINENLAIYIKDGNEFRHSSMVGSGVRIFAILKELNSRRFLDKDAVLIIDEPEIGVNPKLQVRLRQALSLLDCKVLFTTHSSFMLTVGSTYILASDNSFSYILESDAYKFLIQYIGGD